MLVLPAPTSSMNILTNILRISDVTWLKNPNTSGYVVDNIKTNYKNNMVVNDTNESEIINIVNEFNLSKSIGLDTSPYPTIPYPTLP